jgi:glycosidase
MLIKEKKYFTDTIKSNPIFQGHILTTNEKGEKEYQFYLPTKQKNIKAEAVLINNDGKIVKDLTPALKKTEEAIPVWTLPISDTYDRDVLLAYRFLNHGKLVLDNTLKTKNQKYNEAIDYNRPALNMPRQMYHLMPDNFNPNDGEILSDKFGKEIQRNHFSKFDGSIKDIINKITEIKNLGAKRIISTPIFGDDRVSNHGYWTVNPYQITSSLGDINDFKKLQIELFKNGMGWVADGAFANEGVEGIHIQDIIRWGEKSPYANWFDVKDFSLNGFRFGLLPPVGSEAEKYYDFKLINSPLLYTFDNQGNPDVNFGKVNSDYDATKPTYLQQFDRRLMEEGYINSSEMLNSYKVKQLEDVHTIKNYKNSVQLLSFRVDSKQAEEKIKEMKKIKIKNQSSPHSLFRNLLKKWDNFTLNPVDKEGTIRNWTGKKDIFALNYTNSDVQDYIINTAKYWTDETDKILTTYVAKRLAGSNEDLQTEIKKITNLFGINLTNIEVKNILSGEYKIQLSPVENSIKGALKDVPIISTEVPREISSLFSDPSVVNNSKFDKIYDKHIVPIVENVFKSLHPDAFRNDILTDEGRNLFRLASSDIMRYIIAYALSGETPSVTLEEGYNKIKLPEKFEEKVFNNINYESSTRLEAINKLLNGFEKGAKNLKSNSQAQQDINNIIHNSLNGVDFKTLNIAKAVISKLEAGLEWRIDASKDIMDLDQITQNKAAAQRIWKVVENFWAKFNETIREYNPKSYIIGEVTCMWDYFQNEADNVEKTFIKETKFTTQTNYSHIFNILNQLVHGAPEVGMGHDENHKSISDLNSSLKKFFESGYADNIRYSHEGVGNHDKPRALHGYAINIADFFGNNIKNQKTIINSQEFKSIVAVIKESKPVFKSKTDKEMFDMIRDGDWLFADNDIMQKLLTKDSSKKAFFSFKKDLEVLRNKMLNKNEINAVKDALLDSLSNVKKKMHLKNSDINAIEKAINDYADGAVSSVAKEHFTTRPYNYIIEDTITRANLLLNKAESEKFSDYLHEEMLKPAFAKFKAMLGVLVSLPGNPTIYAGDEYGETGFETPGNNVYQHNRNQIHRNWVQASNKPEFAKFYDETKKIFNLRNNKYFSPFVNGDTIILEEFAGNKVGGVYRYNKQSDVIAVFNTNALNNVRKSANVYKIKVKSIPVNANFNITHAYATNEFIRMNMHGEKVNDGFYKIINNVLKRFDDAGFTKEALDIDLNDTATYFVRNIKKVIEEKTPSVTEALRASIKQVKI